MKPESGYTLQINLDINNKSLPMMRMHFEHLQDAFDKFVSVTPHEFDVGLWEKPFRDLRVTEASIIDRATGEVLVSSELLNERFGQDLEHQAGFYFIVPSSVGRFEQESGISFNSFKGYNPNSEYLLAAIIKDCKELTLTELTGYENLQIQSRERLYERNLFAASFQQHVHKSEVIHLNNGGRLPLQEDYFYEKPDEALHHLLRMDFNALDELVSWENDLPVFFSKASVYWNSTGLASGTGKLVELHSARRNGLSFGWESYSSQRIYLELSRVYMKMGMHYPFSDLEKMSSSRHLYLAGTYNDSYTQAEKVPGLLAPFEKKKKRIATPSQKNKTKDKSRGKSI